MRITNLAGVSLPLAVWLLYDEYDYIKEENYISATGLMKPLRQIVLANRVDKETQSLDVLDLFRSSLGHALHDSIEKAWLKGHRRSLKLLGYPENVIDMVRINPSDAELAATPGCIPVYMEQRNIREIEVDGHVYKIGGKFDLCIEGMLQDYKSTSAFVWVAGSRDDEHREQGSIYRWLHRDKITSDHIRINYIFTDWKKYETKNNPKYPEHPIMHKDISLWSIAETEEWIKAKIRQIIKHQDAPEPKVPECTDEELWKSDPVYKYFSDPEKAKIPGSRSTKNFDSMPEARVFMMNEKKGKGTIVTVPGEPKRCSYCGVFDVCSQKDRYIK
ncbi:exonuclease [Achromobacter phage vB_AxyP_19-32_Axy11]|uniref:PD-(D/E)XK endonuclease-like domain-containing protein n=2 Tax=Pourcelvirus Axy11 TaxID=2843622 RepID=A0A514CVW0_9CAUD|nr:exonuclease [Achromobacter phage vB_AxyP_19-32_Axy11]QDH84014.1 hypothetical protein Axy11_049 [Achromobacter phage vB_AxyP_19-32_Axy11]QDH84610.1 hypothetical protein Axy22_047 [Achromobacter phage vB_AxyP_19-32_Axy22]